MRCCRALKERLPRRQLLVLKGLGIEQEDVLMQESKAGVLKPSFILIRDCSTKKILLAVRGTHSMKDMFTSLTGASKPHHMMNEQGVVLGHSHFGMLAAARWIMGQTTEQLLAAVRDNPGFDLKLMGHSLGGGTAALLTMMLRDSAPEFKQATCLAIACPACMTLDLARSCSHYVTSLVNNTDIIPTISPGSSDGLREEVMRSAWYEAFRADMRASALVRAVEVGLGQVGFATSWTSNKLAAASQGLRACYPARLQPKRRHSGDDLRDTAELEERLRMEAQRPHAAAATNIEVASEWVDCPREGDTAHAAPSPPSAGWGRTLGRLWSGERQPQGGIGSSGSGSTPPTTPSTSGMPAEAALAGTHPQPILQRQQAWWVGGGRDGQALSLDPLLSPPPPTHAQPAAAGSLPLSRSLVRRSLDMISGGWLRGCYPPQGHLVPQALAATAEETAEAIRTARSLSAPQGLEDASILASLQADAELGLLGSPRGSSQRVPPPGQLDEEMHAVRAAVAAAEEDELQRLSRLPRNPSTASIPGSSPGQDSPIGLLPGSSVPLDEDANPADEHHKRLSYPAGRILHLVPARLIYPSSFAASSPSPTPRAPASSPEITGPIPQDDSGASASRLHHDALSTAPFSPHGMDRGELEDQLDESHLLSTPSQTPPSGTSPDAAKPQQAEGHQGLWGARCDPSALHYEFAPAEFDGTVMILRRHYPSDGEGEEEETVPLEVPLVAREQFLILDSVPQEVYGKMRLCNTMLTDHFIPRYLANLESCIDLLANPDSVLAESSCTAEAASRSSESGEGRAFLLVPAIFNKLASGLMGPQSLIRMKHLLVSE
ncbi:hypothetical protein WJX84_002088 [Apatococcus fuscideae]|uniref:Fungal lipase-type domain-containing protein n=1 Tax=Apatococcus fuscideae TaxID=2026836 RepID=A0AAW1SPL2_9CHLO